MAIGEDFDAQQEPTSFPKTPLFERVVQLANRHRLSEKVVFNDHKYDIKATHADLLTDVLCLRVELLRCLSPTARSDLKADKDVYIGIIANASYEWLVGCLSIISIGAAVVLIGKVQYSG
jgi:malonyl-CoA/methylmalonyl-CoA synthetase